MADKYPSQALRERYNRLAQNGKNKEGTGVLRRIQREIRHAEQHENAQKDGRTD